MKEALKNLALVTFGILMCTFAVWFYLRNKGLSEPIRPPIDHAFFKSGQLGNIAFRGESLNHPANTIEALEAAARLSPEVIIWADIVPNKGGDLVLADPKLDLSRDYFSAEQSGPPLTEALIRIPQNRMILNFRHNRPGMAEAIMKIIDETKSSDRVLVQSPEDGLLKDLREKRPLWLFGTSQAQATRMKMLSAIGLEALAPLKGDVYVMEWDPARPTTSSFSEKAVEEAHRRKMKVIAGPAPTLGEIEKLRSAGVDGVLTSRIFELVKTSSE